MWFKKIDVKWCVIQDGYHGNVKIEKVVFYNKYPCFLIIVLSCSVNGEKRGVVSLKK